ncbi:hypothetical protein HDU98_008456 [Podochytrium sp. JEL0797]|nr:hypothetical protein HDU98_008456 [Podochytrium sp. JEL0797]
MGTALSTLVEAFRDSFGECRIRVEFSKLSYAVAGRTLLDNVGGVFEAGRMVAVIGPSGAGKTTFMNALMGKIDCLGDIRVNEVSNTTLSSLKRAVGYVPQDDIMCRELTVREVVLYSARTRLPREWSCGRIESFVDAILEVLK